MSCFIQDNQCYNHDLIQEKASQAFKNAYFIFSTMKKKRHIDNLILKGFKYITSIQELLDFINDTRTPTSEPLKLEQLEFYCNPDNQNRYIYFDIPKKSGKTPRHIASPVKELKTILHYLNYILQTQYQPNEYTMGFVPFRSVCSNAELHINKNYVFNIDLKNFFSSIEKNRIRITLTKQLHLTPAMADIIANLCCIKIYSEENLPHSQYILPQGFPTSPILTNIICQELDDELAYLAQRFNATYSRYADDITFSSMHNIYQEKSEFITKLKKIIATQQFKINPDKTRLQKKGSRQIVTGVIVNTKPNVSRKYIREIRSILHIWESFGYDVACEKFRTHYVATKGYIKPYPPKLEEVLLGKLQYLKIIKGSQDSTYQTLQYRFDMLNDPPMEQCISTDIPDNSEETPSELSTTQPESATESNEKIENDDSSFKRIIRTLETNGCKRISNIHIKNVNVTEKDNYTMVSFTLTSSIRGYVYTENGYELGKTNLVFTSLYAIFSTLKEDENKAWLAFYFLSHPQALNPVLNGAQIDILQQDVIAGKEYVNPFSTKANQKPQVYDHDLIINHIISFKLSATGEKMAGKVADKLLGF